MELLTAFSVLIGHVAWPLTVLTLAILFRREVRRLAERFTKIEYHGASITLREVELLADRARHLQENEMVSAESAPIASEFGLGSTDPNIMLAQARVDIERELFRWAQVATQGGKVEFVSLPKRVTELSVSKSPYASLRPELAAALIQFSEYFERWADDASVPIEIKSRLAAIGMTLLARVHRARLIAELAYDFDAHGLWHMHSHVADKSKKYYWWSAVAATCPEFEYSYDVYRTAAEQHNAKLIREMGIDRAQKGIVEIISIDDFFSVLQFRESELQRVLRAYEQGQDAFSKANEWQWPGEWGNIGWSGPVVRGWLRDVERELMETQATLVRLKNAQPLIPADAAR